MAFPLFTCGLWSLSLLTALLASTAPSSMFDDDPLQPVTSDETVAVGGTVTLTCHVAASDESSLQWSNTAQQTLYFGDKRALRDNRIKLHHSTSTELSITISDVQLSDEGEYTCSIFTMPVRTAHATVTVLGVPDKPQITGYEEAVLEGKEVTLTCSSTSSKPPAKLHWYRGDQELQGHPDVLVSEPDKPTYKVIGELTLEVSRSDDNALITCAVDHPSLAPGDKRSEQPLRVLFTPEVNIQPENDLPREGEKFYLQCLAKGNPNPLSYTWEKKEGELPPLAKVDGAFLVFEMLNKSDNGVYLCEANNGIGKSQGEYALLVQDDSADPSSSSSSTSSSSSSSYSSSSSSSSPSSSSSFPTASFTQSSPPASSAPTSSPSSASTGPSHTLPPSASAGQAPDQPTAQTLTPTATLTPTPTAPLSNVLFPDLATPSSHSTGATASPALPSGASSSSSSHSSVPPTSSVSVRLNGVYTFTDPTAMSTSSGVDHAVIGGVVAVIVFILLCLLIVLGRYLIRHKGTYLTHEAKGSDDAPDADTAIINAEGGHSGGEDKKEYFI